MSWERPGFLAVSRMLVVSISLSAMTSGWVTLTRLYGVRDFTTTLLPTSMLSRPSGPTFSRMLTRGAAGGAAGWVAGAAGAASGAGVGTAATPPAIGTSMASISGWAMVAPAGGAAGASGTTGTSLPPGAGARASSAIDTSAGTTWATASVPPEAPA